MSGLGRFFAATLLIASLLQVAGEVAAESALETIEPKTALAEIQRSRGVVLLDLYAEW